jgi:ubiquitin-activating enzyme E1
VQVHSGELNEDVWKNFHVVIYSDLSPLSHLTAANEFCHANGIVFIYATNLGVTSTIFSDFGPEHTVNDPNGEPTKINVVEDVTADGIVTVSGDRHGLDDGDFVTFEEVEGMIELNELENPVPVKRVYRKNYKGNQVLVPNKFQIDASVDGFGKYTTGGIASQVNVPKTYSYKTLAEAIKSPLGPNDFMFPHMDMNKMLMANQGAQLHIAKLAIWEFQERNGRMPGLHSEDDAQKCVEIANEINDKNKEDGSFSIDSVDETIVKNAALYSTTELCGFTAFLGGVIAQEAVKAPGKFLPINQWLHHDALELCNEDGVPEDAASQNTRYDWQINILGASNQDKLMSQNWFLVGAGALGCEYIKGIALMGVGAKGGVVHLTDMDRIEVSNLNRQFLFRRDNVGMPKSVCAAEAAKVMNPDLNVSTYEIPVGPDTEDHFNAEFWSSLDGVWNALDNVKARKYTDSKCVFFEKPLLESGTLGTKANSEIILPHQTTCYSDHKEVEQDSIPMCTLRNFPHFIEHCIEWARAQFSELFEDSAQELNSLLTDKEKYYKQLEKEGNAVAQLEKLEVAKSLYDKIKNGVDLKTCVSMSIDEFTKQYRNRIRDLTHAFPEDARKTDKDTGEDLGAFWSGEKRFPQSAAFDPEDELHLSYVLNTANLFAYMFGLPEERDESVIRGLAQEVAGEIPEWKPKNVKIDLGDEEGDDKEEEVPDEAEDKLAALKQFFENESFDDIKELNVADFEKDDDTNFHIDFITACSNLRAWNYRIKLASRHKCKMIAGKIIPALATTTAMITGLVEIELLKYVLGLPAAKFANTNVNLAVNQFQSFEPLEPKKAKAEMDPIMFTEVVPIPDGFTVWDKVTVNAGDLTVAAFVEELSKVHYGVKLGMLFKDGISQNDIDEGKAQPLYNSNPYLPAKMKEQNAANFERNLRELYVENYGEIPEVQNYVVLTGDFTDKDGNDCKIPRIAYYFK